MNIRLAESNEVLVYTSIGYAVSTLLEAHRVYSLMLRYQPLQFFSGAVTQLSQTSAN